VGPPTLIFLLVVGLTDGFFNHSSQGETFGLCCGGEGTLEGTLGDDGLGTATLGIGEGALGDGDLTLGGEQSLSNCLYVGPPTLIFLLVTGLTDGFFNHSSQGETFGLCCGLEGALGEGALTTLEGALGDGDRTTLEGALGEGDLGTTLEGALGEGKLLRNSDAVIIFIPNCAAFLSFEVLLTFWSLTTRAVVDLEMWSRTAPPQLYILSSSSASLKPVKT